MRRNKLQSMRSNKQLKLQVGKRHYPLPIMLGDIGGYYSYRWMLGRLLGVHLESAGL